MARNKKKKTKETPEFKALQRDYVSTVFGTTYCDAILNIPENESGPFEVKDDIDIDNDYIYQTLRDNDSGTIIDDNNPARLSRHQHFLDKAHGNILVSGLGLGGGLYELLKSPEVEHIKIIEYDQHVIDLVRPAFEAAFDDFNDRVEIVQGDIFKLKLKRNEHYDFIYHSIWNDRKGAKLEDRELLSERFEPHCDWHGFVFFTGKGGVRRGAGRKLGVKIGPIKPSRDRRTVRKGIRYTPDEYKLLKKASELSGISESAIAQQGAVRESLRVVREIAVKRGLLGDKELRGIIQGVEGE